MKGIKQQEAKQNTGPLLTIHEQACLFGSFVPWLSVTTGLFISLASSFKLLLLKSEVPVRFFCADAVTLSAGLYSLQGRT